MRTMAMKEARLSIFFLMLLAACDCDVTGPDLGPGPIDIDIDPKPYQAAAEFSFEVSLKEQTTIHLRGINGDVQLVGSDLVSKVKVSGTRRVRSDSQEDADAHLPLLEVRAEEGSEEILLESRHPRNDSRDYAVDYTVTFPRHLDAWVENTNGDVSLEGLMGDAVVKLVNGEIYAGLTLPPRGIADLFTVNGKLDLVIQRDASAQFQATLTHGTILTSNLDLQEEVVTPRSVTGRMGDGAGSVSLALVNGDIRARGR